MAKPMTGGASGRGLARASTGDDVERAKAAAFSTGEDRGRAAMSSFRAGAAPGGATTSPRGLAPAAEGPARPRRLRAGAGKGARAAGPGRAARRPSAASARDEALSMRISARRRELMGRRRVRTALGAALSPTEADADDHDFSDQAAGDARRAAMGAVDAHRALEASILRDLSPGRRLGRAASPQARRAALSRARRLAEARAKAQVVTDMGVRVRVATTVRAIAASIASGVAAVASALLPVLGLVLAMVLALSMVVSLVSCNTVSTDSLNAYEAEVAAYLSGLEFTPQAIAAVLGNMSQESGVDPTVDADDGFGTVSLGLLQLTGLERTGFLSWCSANGLAWDTVAAQMRWTFSGEEGTWGGSMTDPGWYQSGYRWTSTCVTGSLAGYYAGEPGYEERFGVDWCRTGEEFRTSTDLEVATFSWMACYERPASHGLSGLANRLSAAGSYLERLLSGTGRGPEYMASSEEQRRIADACRSVPSPGSGLCAMWVSQVYQAAGLGYPSGNADGMYYAYTWSTDRADLKVGMIVAVPSWPGTALGRQFGHVGIYVGDGMVMHNVGTVETMGIDEWCRTYGATNQPRWGYATGSGTV